MAPDNYPLAFKSEAVRQCLFDFLYMFPIGVARLTALGEIELANPEMSRLILAAACGGWRNNFFDAMERFAPELRAMTREFRQPTGSISVWRRIPTPGGGSGVQALSCTLIKTSGDAVMALLWDITALVAQERALLQANQFLKMSQRLARVGHFYFDFATGRLELSDEVFRICGRNLEDGVPNLTRASTWVHADDLAALTQAVKTAIARGKGFEREARVVRPDGDTREIRCRCEIDRGARGEIAGWFGIVHDISETKHAEREEARLREAAEKASRAKTDFLATMSHELRTPMNGIIGMNALLLETELTPLQAKLGRTVEQSANALLAILDDILVMAKLAAGRLQLNEAEFDLVSLVEQVVDLMEAPARQKGLSLTLSVRSSFPSPRKGDSGRLRQILINLVSNAIKFTPRGGVAIDITGRSETDEPERVRFEIEDTGVGVRPDMRDRLFQPFGQGDVSMSRIYGGAGLGLSISRGLVHLMGGDMGFADRPGGGSTFWVEIPFARAPVAEEAVEERSASEATAGRVLLAEDNSVNAEFVSLVLAASGFEVQIVADGLEALEAVRALDFDLVVMDMQMPRLDGLDATRAIRALPSRKRHVPIIALTANAFPRDRRLCFEAGMDDYLAKPVPPNVLRAVATKWVNSARALRNAPAALADDLQYGDSISIA